MSESTNVPSDEPFELQAWCRNCAGINTGFVPVFFQNTDQLYYREHSTPEGNRCSKSGKEVPPGSPVRKRAA